MDQTGQAKETHRMEIVNDIYKKLHDLDYFLLRYGSKDVAKYVKDAYKIVISPKRFLEQDKQL